MTDQHDANLGLLDDEFERLGKRAGAELRRQPPPDGPGSIVRTVQRRRTKIVALAAGVTVAIVVTGLAVANARRDESPPIATVPPTPADAVRTTTPGTWRELADPSSIAPEFPDVAVWTGTDVIVIGSHVISDSELAPPTAAAYDVGQDRWRELASPPSAFTNDPNLADPQLQWTGSEVLAATNEGEVFAYDPEADLWAARALPAAEMSLPAADALVAVSARGVLARSSTGWWWYDDTTDLWEPVPAPADDLEYSRLVPLDQERILAIHILGRTITSTVFDIAARTWRTGLTVDDGPMSSRSETPTQCDANDGLLVCFAEQYGGLDGVVIDPLLGELDRFELGSHASAIATRGLPWFTHALKILSPRTATWEDLPPIPDSDVDSFGAAAWTGSEIVFLGGGVSASGEPLGVTAAYTPLQLPAPRPEELP